MRVHLYPCRTHTLFFITREALLVQPEVVNSRIIFVMFTSHASHSVTMVAQGNITTLMSSSMISTLGCKTWDKLSKAFPRSAKIEDMVMSNGWDTWPSYEIHERVGGWQKEEGTIHRESNDEKHVGSWWENKAQNQDSDIAILERRFETANFKVYCQHRILEERGHGQSGDIQVKKHMEPKESPYNALIGAARIHLPT